MQSRALVVIAFVAALCALASAKNVPKFGVATPDDAVLRRELERQFTVRSLPCSCVGVSCSCCAGVNIQQFNFNQQGCVNFTYDASSLEVAMNVLSNNRTLYETRISGRNPPPFCVPIPQFPAVMFCARFYDIHQEGGNLVACIRLEVQAISITVLVINFDCIKIGVDGVSIVKPPAHMQDERPLAGVKPKPPTEVVIVLHPTAATAITAPTYDASVSLAAGNGTEIEASPPAPAPAPGPTEGQEVDDFDAVEENLVRATTTEATDEDEDDYDDQDEEESATPAAAMSPALVDTVVVVKRIVGDYKNYSVKLGEPIN